MWLVEPAVRSSRLFNTAFDFFFSDVPTLRAALAAKEAATQVAGDGALSSISSLNALSDPVRALIIIDATTALHVYGYRNVENFLESSDRKARSVDIATITGVGSSELGSAALAWDISVALRKPVLAIVPGYGVAEVILQATSKVLKLRISRESPGAWIPPRSRAVAAGVARNRARAWHGRDAFAKIAGLARRAQPKSRERRHSDSAQSSSG